MYEFVGSDLHWQLIFVFQFMEFWTMRLQLG